MRLFKSWREAAFLLEGLGREGFTVMGFLIAMALMIILVMSSMPFIQDLLQSYRLRAAAWQFAGDLRLARQKAVSTQQSHRVRFVDRATEPNSNTYVIERNSGASWIQDLPVPPGLFVFSPGVVIDSTSTPSSRTISFSANGNASPAGTVRLKNDSGGYEVALDLVGRVRVCRCKAPCSPATSPLDCSWL